MTIQDMTLEDLERMIEDKVRSELTEIVILTRHELALNGSRNKHSWTEVRRFAEKTRWTPPPGTPSITSLLREDRER